MPDEYSTELLVGWEGSTVQAVERVEPGGPGGRAQGLICLTRTKATYRCSGCAQETPRVHEVSLRCVRELPILDADTYVHFARYRVA